MKLNKNHQKPGIYCIRNTVNNKVYIGKSINIYKRLQQHLANLRTGRIRNENRHLSSSWEKHGESSFEYFVIEFLELDIDLLKERELYWMKSYDSLNREKGYNLRSDSSSNMIVHFETSKKVSERVKNEWKEGKHKNHAINTSKAWKDNPIRRMEQSIFMSKLLAKYYYEVYKDNHFIDNYTYKDLVNNGLKSCMGKFKRKNSNEIDYKGFKIKRVIIKDIVRSLEKSKTNKM